MEATISQVAASRPPYPCLDPYEGQAVHWTPNLPWPVGTKTIVLTGGRIWGCGDYS